MYKCALLSCTQLYQNQGCVIQLVLHIAAKNIMMFEIIIEMLMKCTCVYKCSVQFYLSRNGKRNRYAHQLVIITFRYKIRQMYQYTGVNSLLNCSHQCIDTLKSQYCITILSIFRYIDMYRTSLIKIQMYTKERSVVIKQLLIFLRYNSTRILFNSIYFNKSFSITCS